MEEEAVLRAEVTARDRLPGLWGGGAGTCGRVAGGHVRRPRLGCIPDIEGDGDGVVVCCQGECSPAPLTINE